MREEDINRRGASQRGASRPEALRITLVRHGETEWNLERRLQGHLDVALNEHGRRQARQTGAALRGADFTACFCSDLQRAAETAQLIVAAREGDLPVTALAALRERHYGVFQGLTHAEAAARYAPEYAFFARREAAANAPDGESLGAFRARVAACLHRLAQAHGGGHLLVVTHGGVLRVIHALASADFWQAPAVVIPNSAINRIRYHAGRVQIEHWAQVDHLDAPSQDELPEAGAV